MKALDLLLRQKYRHTNKQNFKYTFREFLDSLKLIHRSCRDALITDKTPVLGLDTRISIYFLICLEAFSVLIFGRRNLFFNYKNNNLTLPAHPSNSTGSLVCSAGEQKVDNQPQACSGSPNGLSTLGATACILSLTQSPFSIGENPSQQKSGCPWPH